MATKASSGTRPLKRNRILEQIHLNAAGIDAGASEHWVAVPEDGGGERVRKFGTTTSQLIELRAWLVGLRD